ncbi:MAG TPA: Dabb family protein [Microbacteriaceae bacterium]|nr:Dabb family protein [Microbacteriaceae bacterium]
MTLRHIVCWRLNGASKSVRDEQAAKATALLMSLPAKISVIKDMQVHRNELFDGDNFDLMLVADFANSTDLAEYAAHPEHQPAISLMKSIASERSAIDFTL